MTQDNNKSAHPYYPLNHDEAKAILLQSGLTIEEGTGLLVSHNPSQGGGGWPTTSDLKKFLELTPNYDKKFDLTLFLATSGNYSVDENNFIVMTMDTSDAGGWPHWVDFAAIQRKIGEYYHPELKEKPILTAEDFPPGMFGVLLNVVRQKSEEKRVDPSAVDNILNRIQNIRDDGLGHNDKDNKPKL
jgi:hypothetical protein